MTGKTFIRFMALVIVLTAGIMMFSASGSNNGSSAKEECTAGKDNCDEKKAQSELLLLESLTDHLFGATQ